MRARLSSVKFTPERHLPDVLNGPQIRELLHLGETRFAELVKAGALPFVRRNGRAYAAARADVEAYQQRGTASVAPEPATVAVQGRPVDRFVIAVGGLRLTILVEADDAAK